MPGLKRKIAIASGREKAELVFKNARVINVFTNEILPADLAVEDGIILAVGSYEGLEEIDLQGKYICPSLFDGHVHIESAMVSPSQFAKVVLPHGVTTVIADPHEIANVKGLDGIDYMLEATEELPLTVYIMVPSCVPATPFESSGAILEAEELAQYIGKPRVLGLGEMMNYPGVYNADSLVIEKLKRFQEFPIDGHGPLIEEKELATYAVAGIRTEHECSTPKELIDRVRLGMYVQLREGSGAKNVVSLLRGIDAHNISRCFFCTDDRHPNSLLAEGSIDNNVRIAIREGMDPIDAIKLGATFGPLAYGIKGIGAIAPNYRADFIVLDELESFAIHSVYVGGECIVEGGELLPELKEADCSKVGNSVTLSDRKEEDLRVPAVDGKYIAIRAISESLITEKAVYDAPNGADFNYEYGLKKLVVFERHRGLKRFAAAAIDGFGNLDGAIALTIAHDSHNVIAIGSSDREILAAVDAIERLEGGIVLVKDGEVIGQLRLEIAGLMSTKPLEEVEEKFASLMKKAIEILGINPNLDPFMTLSFMALPVIPNIKLTDLGLFDVESFSFIYGGKNDGSNY